MQKEQNEAMGKGFPKDPIIEPSLFFDSKETKRKFPWVLLVSAVVIAISAYLIFARWDKGIQAEGIVQAKHLVKVGVTQPGVLKEILYKRGDSVNEGAILARLKNMDFERNLEERKLDLQMLKQDSQLTQNKIAYLERKILEKLLLFENGLIGKSLVDEIRFEIDQAKETKAIKEKQIEVVQKQISFHEEKMKALEIKAPFSGVILEDPSIKGENSVKAGDNLFELADPKSFYIEAGVPENRVREISEGDGVQIQLEAFKSQTVKGKVVRIGERAEKEVEKVFKIKHIVPCEIEFEKVPSGLKFGMISKIGIRPGRRESLKSIKEVFKKSNDRI